MSHTTEEAREYARQRRQAKRDAANMDTLTCQALLGRGAPCRARLQSRFVNGITVPFCPRCDKKARGICIDCDAPVVGMPRRALRCALHKRLATHAALERHRRTHRKRLAKKERKRLADPVVRAARLAYKKLWRQSRPGKVTEYKRTYAARNREKVLAYQAAYRARHQVERAARELARHHGTLLPRACLTCPTIITGRAKRCDACKQQSKANARQAIARMLEVAA